MSKHLRPQFVAFLFTFAALSPSTVSAQNDPPSADDAPSGDSSAANDKTRLAEYIKRWIATPPRRADAQVALAEWCQTQGLAGRAREHFEKAIAIDSDCKAARTALGYERYGTEWRRKGERPAARISAATTGSSSSTSGTRPRTESKPPPTETATASAETVAREAADTADAATVEVVSPSSRLEEKKKWAAAAAERFGIRFQTFESSDFLIHSTLAKGDKPFKDLVAHLKHLKSTLASVIGREKTVWPAKLQLVLLRSEPEYERFALNIDGVKSARNPEGSYTQGEHTVLWKPHSEKLPIVVGATAVEEFGEPTRWVGWWLRDGIAELVLARSAVGQRDLHYETTFLSAAEELAEDGDGTRVYQLLETPENQGRRAQGNEALAMTLVDFLVRKSGRGFAQFLRTMKSTDAPALPADEAEFDTYFAAYVAFQEKALAKHLRMSGAELNQRWKAYVGAVAAKAEKTIEAAEKEAERKENERRDRDRDRGGRRGGRGRGGDRR